MTYQQWCLTLKHDTEPPTGQQIWDAAFKAGRESMKKEAMSVVELGSIAEKLEELGAAFAEELGRAYRAGRESMKAEALKVVPEKWNMTDPEKRKYRGWTPTDLLYELGFQPLDAIRELEP